MKNKYPLQCEKIQGAFNINKIPCLIISDERLGISQNELDEIALPKNFGILKRGFFVEELCRDTSKLDSLLYDIYDGVKRGKSVHEVFRDLKLKYYLGKAYREGKKWISF